MGAATHDSNMAIAIGGRVVAVLELERLFEQRYFSTEMGTDNAGNARFEAQLRRAFSALLGMAALPDPSADRGSPFDIALYPNAHFDSAEHPHLLVPPAPPL